MITSQTIRDLAAVGDLLRSARASELQAAFGAAELQLRALLASPELAALLASQANHESPPRQPAGHAPNEVVLADSNRVRVSLGTYVLDSELLHTVPVRGVYCVLSNSPVMLQRFALPAEWRNDIFAEGVRLQPTSEVTLFRGAMVRVDGAREVLQFRAVAPVVLGKLVGPLCMVQRWVFDPVSLRALRVECADERIDALRQAVEVLRSMGSPHSATGLLCMTHHRAHFLRWEAIRALMYVDRDAGMRRLQAAVADRHPDVRIAAATALESLARKERVNAWPSH